MLSCVCVYLSLCVAQVAGGSSNNGVTKAKVATILFAAKASTFNWFDPDILTRHAIQWMPFNPASNALLPAAWLQESVPLVQAGTQMPTNRYEELDCERNKLCATRMLAYMTPAPHAHW
jgi:hypothetical protein